MFATQREAKQFFVNKVIEQARHESVRLSDAEQGMLAFSESDPETQLTADQARALIDRLAAEMSEEQYESKIAGLLTRAYTRDETLGSRREETWRNAYAKLNEGDHYIAVMIDRGLARALRRKWSLWFWVWRADK